ncbi:hypothetical protein, partial [Novosphingobium rosa]|uniref:hypothetical protein n=1 Tax=Novosphingobium rosa TaxID=76978 RepID=UPI001C3F7B70
EVHAAGTRRWWAGIEEYAGKGWAMVILDRVLWVSNTRRCQSLPLLFARGQSLRLEWTMPAFHDRK